MEGSDSVVSEAAVQADGAEVLPSNMEVGNLSECSDPPVNGAHQRAGIASTTVTWVRTDSTYLSIARKGHTLTRHSNQSAPISNTAVSTELDCALLKWPRFGEGGQG